MKQSLKNYFQRKFQKEVLFSSNMKDNLEIHELIDFPSVHLQRTVRIKIFLPPGFDPFQATEYPSLYFNDGQDMKALKMSETLQQVYQHNSLQKLLVIAVHAGDRGQEYGTASQLDYKQRGRKARQYGNFITQELVPMVRSIYHASAKPTDTCIAGFSLGGLSALDIAWDYPDIFAKVGLFSASLWWRSQAYTPDDPDGHRIMHQIIRDSVIRPGFRFWLQTGTNDETEDRNNNGIIDSIDDTMDLIRELEKLSYRQGHDIRYVEVKGGYHNQATWHKVMPDFLHWMFSR